MAKDIHVPARIEGGKIPVKASLGQTVIVTEGPEKYTGPVTVTPTESEQTLLTKDKLVTDNISVNPIPSEYVDAKADYEDALTAFGVESDLADGISALTEYSNEITGQTDENLSDAVRTLADGYDDGSVIASLLDGTFTGECRNDAPINGMRINSMFSDITGLTSIILPNFTGNTKEQCFRGCTNLESVVMPNVTELGRQAFFGCSNLSHVDVRNVEIIGMNAFNRTKKMDAVIFLKSLTVGDSIGLSATEIRMCQRPASVSTTAFGYQTIDHLYVPWSEGEVSGYPWGGTIRNIHYNTVFDSEGNIISST